MIGSFRRRGCTCKKKKCTCGSKWHYRYHIIDPETGKRKQKETRGFLTKPEAEEEAKKIIAELSQGTYIEEKNISFQDFSAQWIEFYETAGRVKNSTVFLRKSQLKILLSAFGAMRIKDINKLTYQKMLNDMFSSGYSKKTISGAHEVGKMIFEKAVELEKIKNNPTQYAVIPSQQETIEDLEKNEVPRYLEKSELSHFLKVAKDFGEPSDYPIFLLLSYSGMRSGEALALKWSDINESNCTIGITKTLFREVNNYQKYTLQTPKTKSSRRVIDVDQVLIKVLESHKRRQNSLKMENRKTYHDKDFVFTSENFPGYPITAVRLIRRMETLLKIAGLPPLTPHSLRHTHTSLLAEAGVSLDTIMDRLGHKSDTTTKGIYLHVTKELKKEASQKFAKLMGDL